MTLYRQDDFTQRRDYGASVWRFLGPMVLDWLAKRRARAERRRGLVEMSEMADWQLRDIGLHRGDVDRLLYRNKISLDEARPSEPH